MSIVQSNAQDHPVNQVNDHMKICSIIHSAVAAALACAALSASAQTAAPYASSDSSDPTKFLFLGIPAIIVVLLIGRYRRVQAMLGNGFAWYCAQSPKNFRDGRVHCSACDSANIRTERLMNQTYVRAHVCGQCGTKLYFTKE